MTGRAFVSDLPAETVIWFHGRKWIMMKPVRLGVRVRAVCGTEEKFLAPDFVVEVVRLGGRAR